MMEFVVGTRETEVGEMRLRSPAKRIIGFRVYQGIFENQVRIDDVVIECKDCS